MNLFSEHVSRRLQQRGIVEDDVYLAIQQGIRLHRTGITFYFLGAKQTRWLKRRCDRLHGLTVLQANDGEVITAYKNRKALRRIKRKLAWDARRLSVSDPRMGRDIAASPIS
jgi:hypothetical protein